MISKEEIEHLKDLARVPARNATHSVAGGEFGAKETEKLVKDLGEILNYVDELKSVDVSSVPEMTHALEGVKNIFRIDEKESASPTALINAFPEKENNYLKVQAIL